jgi:hypothetical protein
VKVPMVAMVVSVLFRAATIAASMAVLGPGSDRPAAVRPAAQRRTAVAGFFAARGMPPLRGRGKKPAVAVAGRRSRRSRPSGLIRPFEVASEAPINGLMETTISAAIVAAQGHGISDRTKTCARASTQTKA